MATGRENKLTGQIAENLVCAELGRQGYIATSFAGNVPGFDVVAADAPGRCVSIQVKGSRGDSWRDDSRTWMDLDFDAQTQRQVYGGPKEIENGDLIYVAVAVAPADRSRYDRFFVFTRLELRDLVAQNHAKWMEAHDWRRPRAPQSYDCRYYIHEIVQFENRWELVSEALGRLPVGDAVRL